MNLITFFAFFKLLGKIYGHQDKIFDVKVCINGINFLLGIATMVFTYAGAQFPYSFMVILFCSLISHLLVFLVDGLISFMENKKSEAASSKKFKILKNYGWIVFYFIGMIPLVLWTSYLYHVIIELFIPIAGKSGGNYVNPDILIGIICALFAFLTCIYFVSF